MDKGQIFLLHFLFLFFQLFLELRQPAVLEFRSLVQVILPLRLLDVLVDLLDLLADLLDTFHRFLLVFPLYFLIGILFFQARKFFLEMFQPLAA